MFDVKYTLLYPPPSRFSNLLPPTPPPPRPHTGTSVELDAESQVEVTCEMDDAGLIPVGWYHSHPVFEPRPSAKDNENQRNYQALCRDAATGLEPWVGAIVGPYDDRLPTPVRICIYIMRCLVLRCVSIFFF